MGCAGEGGGGGCVALRLGGSKDFGLLMCIEASGEPFVAIEVLATGDSLQLCVLHYAFSLTLISSRIGDFTIHTHDHTGHTRGSTLLVLRARTYFYDNTI